MAHPLVLTSLLCLLHWFAEEVGGFQECAHGGGGLCRGCQGDADEFLRCLADPLEYPTA